MLFSEFGFGGGKMSGSILSGREAVDLSDDDRMLFFSCYGKSWYLLLS